jgi:hypothetical protein
MDQDTGKKSTLGAFPDQNQIAIKDTQIAAYQERIHDKDLLLAHPFPFPAGAPPSLVLLLQHPLHRAYTQ